LYNDLGDLLEGLLLLVVKDLVCLCHSLQLVMDIGVPTDTLLFLEVAHELVKVFSTAL
jgi:hypothetical protein